MTFIDTGPIRDYVERWQAVAKREKEERCHLSPQQRWQQLRALIALAEELGLNWREQNEQEVAEVRRRWVHLKETFEREPDRTAWRPPESPKSRPAADPKGE